MIGVYPALYFVQECMKLSGDLQGIDRQGKKLAKNIQSNISWEKCVPCVSLTPTWVHSPLVKKCFLHNFTFSYSFLGVFLYSSFQVSWTSLHNKREHEINFHFIMVSCQSGMIMKKKNQNLLVRYFSMNSFSLYLWSKLSGGDDNKNLNNLRNSNNILE